MGANHGNEEITQNRIIEPQKIKQHFKIVCGIDFGTDGVGLAYSIPSDDNEDNDNKQHEGDIILHEWDKKLSNRMKQKAQILLDGNGKLKAFGEGAANAYEAFEDLDENEEENGEEIKKHESEYKLIDKFKMSLYHDPRWTDDTIIEIQDEMKEVNLEKTIKATDDTPFEAEQVFIETLKYLKKEANGFIKGKLKRKDIEKDDIQWILTIPAIWSNAAKINMRNWAIKAGLISGDYIDQLRMVLEPECAALHIQYLIRSGQIKEKLDIIYVPKLQNNMNKHQESKPLIYNVTDEPIEEEKDEPIEEEKYAQNIMLETGDKYILIDAGGGTVDIVSHQIVNDFGVKEILPAKGGKFGSNVIDEKMEEMLDELFGETNMDNFKKKHPKHYTLLMYNMIWFKCMFNDNNINEYHSIQIPKKFINYMEENVEKVGGNMEQYLKTKTEISSVYNGKPLLKLISDYLQIHNDLWKSWFNVCIKRIHYYCDEILYDDKMKDGQCKYLMLVGGLSESKYFQQKMIDYNSDHKMTIIIPKKPMLSVVHGAARWGIVPNFVLSRRLTKSYGIKISPPIEKIQRYELPQDYIDSHTFEHEGETLIDGVLKVFAKKGDEIELHYVFKDIYRRHTDQQKHAAVSLYECHNDNIPKTVEDEDVSPMGWFRLDFPEDSDVINIYVEYSFDDTILVVTAKWADNEERVHIEHYDAFKKTV